VVMKKIPTLTDVDEFKDFRPVRKTLGDLVDEAATNNPNREALICDESRLTFSQVRNEANRIAKGLIKIGIQKGDRVAIFMENRPEWPIIDFALFKIGAIVINCNTRFTSEDLKYVLNKSEAKLLIMSPEFKEANISFTKIMDELIPEWASSNPENLNIEKLPYLKRIIIVDPEHSGSISMENIIENGKTISDQALKKRQSEVKPEDPANMLFTSGTTGFPKGCVLRHASWITGQTAMGIAWDVTNEDRILLPLGYFTTFATAVGLVLPLIFSIPVVMHKVFDPEKMLETIEKEKISILLVVPTMVTKLFEHPRFAATDFSFLRTGTIGGAATLPEMLLRARSSKKGWGMNAPQMISVYGMTETHGVTTTCTVYDNDERAAYTVGRMGPLVDFRVVDPVTGKDVEVGEEGELLIKGECVMEGYFNDPEQTSEALIDGWLHTKDLVTFDGDGYMRIVGRASEMIITGGFNVFPKEIEIKIMKHEKVMDVSVFRIPDKIYGEVPAAYIIAKPNALITEDEIIEFCRNNIAKYKVPKYFRFVEDFPVNSSGKIQKFKQMQELIEEIGLE